MNIDNRLMFEAFLNNQKPKPDTTSDDPMSRIEAKRKERKNIGSVRTEDAEGHSVEGEIEKLLNYLRQDYSSGLGLDNETLGDVIHEIEDIIRSGNPAGGSEDAESPKETSQEWEVKRHEREQNKWDRRKARWNQWKKENPGKAKEHAAKKARQKGEDAEEQYDKSQKSPYTRGEFDSYNRHPKRPHYYIKIGDGPEHRRVEEEDMSPEEIEAYNAGFEANEKARDWREY
jgi:hypothetical protein